MARAYPELRQFKDSNFVFPWAREVFLDYLDSQSPWLTNPAVVAGELFAQAAGTSLTSQSLATFSRQLEAAYEASQGMAPYGWPSLSLRQKINGVDLAYFVGSDLPFQALLEQAQGADLAIVHEPFQLRYAGPNFPDHGLEHLVPDPALLEEARQYLKVINPKGCAVSGLHVRRGDYAIWQEGKFFFDDQFWLDLCEEQIKADQHVCIFTNDPSDDLCNKLQSLGAHLSAGSPAQDMVRLMMLDVVFGPPSTFPLMARTLAKFCLQRDMKYEMLRPK